MIDYFFNNFSRYYILSIFERHDPLIFFVKRFSLIFISTFDIRFRGFKSSPFFFFTFLNKTTLFEIWILVSFIHQCASWLHLFCKECFKVHLASHWIFLNERHSILESNHTILLAKDNLGQTFWIYAEVFSVANIPSLNV